GEAAAREAAALAAEPRAIPGAAGSWTPLGKGALDASDTTYDATQGSTQEGFNFVTGRVEDFAYDAAHGRLYAAPVNGGLYRSTDDGRSWTDVKLPTGSCSGHTFDDRNCFLANIVTDVVVQAGSNTSTKGAQPGAVLAAVGWRAGRRANIKGKPESPQNGIYTSPTG